MATDQTPARSRRQLEVAIRALRHVVEVGASEDALSEWHGTCTNREFHITRHDGDERCLECGSRWWDLTGGHPHDEPNYALDGIAAKALADIEALGR